jgi:hypothetical protein
MPFRTDIPHFIYHIYLYIGVHVNMPRTHTSLLSVFMCIIDAYVHAHLYIGKCGILVLNAITFFLNEMKGVCALSINTYIQVYVGIYSS